MHISPIKITEKYEDRTIEQDGILDIDGWKLKLYKITYKNNTPADEKTLEIALNFFKDTAIDYTAKYDKVTTLIWSRIYNTAQRNG